MSVELNPNQRKTLELLVKAGGHAAILNLGGVSRGDCMYLQNQGLITVPPISKGRWIQISQKGIEALANTVNWEIAAVANPAPGQWELAPDARFSIVTGPDGKNAFEADKYVLVEPQAATLVAIPPPEPPTPPYASKLAEERAAAMARAIAGPQTHALGHTPQVEQQEIVTAEVEAVAQAPVLLSAEQQQQYQLDQMAKQFTPLDPHAKSAKPSDIPHFGVGGRLPGDFFDPFLLSK